MPETKLKVQKALIDIGEAKSLRASAKELEGFDPLGAKFMGMDADLLEEKAQNVLRIPKEQRPAIGVGGELTLSKEYAAETSSLANTVEQPDNVTAEASRDRLQLTLDLDCTGLALDTAETIQAQNSLEKMLAHQLATAHKLSMTFAKNALDYISKQDSGLYDQSGIQTVESARAANTSAKLMDIYQKGILALNKVRTGGRQTVTVQHVNVSNGGQALVAGALRERVKDEKRQ